MSRLYYIRSLERVWGNHAIWWRENDMGYSESLNFAGKYTELEAKKRVTKDDIAIPVEEVESMAHLAVNASKVSAFCRNFPEKILE